MGGGHQPASRDLILVINMLGFIFISCSYSLTCFSSSLFRSRAVTFLLCSFPASQSSWPLVNLLASGPGHVPPFSFLLFLFLLPLSLPAQSCLPLSRLAIGHSASYQTNQVP